MTFRHHNESEGSLMNNSCNCGQQTTAIVSATPQQLCQLYEPDQAICRGTLFPELDKPLAGVRNTCSPCVTAEQMYDFSAWELRLYLDMHPTDQQALQYYHQLCQPLNGCGYAPVAPAKPCKPIQSKSAKPGCGDNQCGCGCNGNCANCANRGNCSQCQHNNCGTDFQQNPRCAAQADGFVRVGSCGDNANPFVRVDSCGNQPTYTPADQPAPLPTRWTWVEQPWPWELGASCRKED